MRFFKLVLVCCVLFVLSDEAQARRRAWRSYSYYEPSQQEAERASVLGKAFNATAQGVANMMAILGRVGHFGGYNGYEGCGSGFTKEEAYNNCCFANSGMETVDVGFARGENGVWYCCRRYR